MLDQADLVTLALTSRIVPSQVAPLTARQYWPLTRAVDLPWLMGRSAAEIAVELSIAGEDAERVARLLDRGAALALAMEQLEHTGVWTTTGMADRYPEMLRRRLGDAAPPLLHGVGDANLWQTDGVGVVGSRDIGPESADVAREVARAAVHQRLPIVSGAARGVDQHAMNAAFEFGGHVIGVLADSLERTVAKPSTRQGIASGQICLVTPYTPKAPFSAGNAMGRNKIIYALSRCVVVVRSEEGSGGTWGGATEAIRGKFTTVVSWTGQGSAQGNRALVDLGARALESADQIEGQIESAFEQPVPPARAFKADQLSLF
ncbi:DNA-processing protein DprA [Nocardioides carbamazepini]|uniref:DNA-processing protein DprA n=1 Tax=Nocardioides carbamazepini TaxID=2854259 RepID=UPI002149DAE7|nr:DNA-processing protein DprA [Nocardioides carbamazepini]MCR1785486.1 DNA-processing protein DprA [Nocardioides carbamazepini]